MRLARPIVLAAALLSGACATTSVSPSPTGVQWVAPADDPDVLLEPVKRLAEEMVRNGRCRAEFEALPGWPVGRLTTRTVERWSDGSRKRIARTIWRDRNDLTGAYEIDPIVEILASVVINRSASIVATVLIHETAHAASAPHVDDDAHGDNERLAQRIAGLCARAYGMLYVPPGVAQN